MITFDEFITKYNGKGIDFDGAYGFQCMDEMHQYCVDVLGISGQDLRAMYAKNVFEKFDTILGHERFDKIANTPDGIPQKGDIMFWNDTVGFAGHVATFISGDANTFKSFDQNWPTNSLCHIQDHSYKGVSGWLRFKTQPVIISPTMDYKAIFDKTGDIRGLEDRSPKPDFYAPEDEFKKAYIDPTNGTSYVVVNLKALNDTFSSLRGQIPTTTYISNTGTTGTLTSPPYTVTSGDNFTAVVNTPVEVKPDLPANSRPKIDIKSRWTDIKNFFDNLWNKP